MIQPIHNECLVCGAPDASLKPRGERAALECPNCGDHWLSRTLIEVLPHRAADAAMRARLGHFVSKLPARSLVTSSLLDQVHRATPLPAPLERIDLLVSLLASTVEPGNYLLTPKHALKARLGCESSDAVRWVVDQAGEQGLVAKNNDAAPMLTAKGWARFDEHMRSGARSRHAFMAMKFSEEMWRIFEQHMKPAVAQTGFDLRPVAGPHQTAGSIDDRMRVEIRTSRFMVCDLSDGNQGAYWEAGFAEGLGRKVLYTCRADVLHGQHPTVRVHFDTAHQLIIGWDPADPSKGMLDLKNAIRSTLPDEAWMEDRAEGG